MSEPNADAGPAHFVNGSGSNRQAALVPWCRTLAGFARETACNDGIAIQSLAPGTTLMVQTGNSRYRLIVMDDERYGVLVQGGALFREATPAQLQGASAGGNLVKTGWIQVGLRVELRVGPRRVITSPVRSVTIENLPPQAYRSRH